MIMLEQCPTCKGWSTPHSEIIRLLNKHVVGWKIEYCTCERIDGKTPVIPNVAMQELFETQDYKNWRESHEGI